VNKEALLAPHGPAERGKEEAGIRAAQIVQPGMVLGLGTGSTVAYFLDALGARYQAGELPGIVGVPTSLRTEARAQELGIPLRSLEGVGKLDVTVDGADEVDPNLDLVKGLGGALLREKMVAQVTQHLVIIVDTGKIVDRLGTRSPVPLEVVPFGWAAHLPFLDDLGGEAHLREDQGGRPYLTDNQNYILNCSFPDGIRNAALLERAFQERAGIVESGLFLGMAKEILVGGEAGVERVVRDEG
jgi:ribose 5-phosphate isomerase A